MPASPIALPNPVHEGTERRHTMALTGTENQAPDASAVHVFREMVEATEREEWHSVDRLRKTLWRLGWSVTRKPLSNADRRRASEPEREPSSPLGRVLRKSPKLAGA